MTLKVGMVQAAARSGTGTQDFADATSGGFVNDVKAAIILGSNNPGTNESSDVNFWGCLGFAATGLSDACRVFGWNTTDNVTPTVGGIRLPVGTNPCYSHPNPTSDGDLAIFSSWLSNGIQLNWTNASTDAEYISVLFLGGDIEASVGSGNFANGTPPETQTQTHGLSAAPEVILLMHRDSSSGFCGSLGSWITGGTYGEHTLFKENATAAENMTDYVGTDCIAAISLNNGSGTPAAKVTVANVGATTFDLVADAATGGNRYFIWLALRGTTTAITAKNGIFDTATAGGNSTAISGMSAKPQVLVTFPTRRTTTGADGGGTDVGAWGICTAIDQGGVTYYGGTAFSAQDAANPTVEKSQSTNSQAVRILNETPAAMVEATVNSWDTGGVTLNYSTVDGTARKVPYLAFGVQSGSSLILPNRSSGGFLDMQGGFRG